MSINTTEARELFERTTRGKWVNNAGFLLSDATDGCCIVNCEDVDVCDSDCRANMEFIEYTHNNCQAMLDTIERLRLERDVLALNFAGHESGVIVLKRPDGEIEGVAWNESRSASLPSPMLPSYYKKKGGA